MELITSVCYTGKTTGSTVTARGVWFVPTVLELNLQDVGSIGRLFRVLGHHVQVSWSVLLKNTDLLCFTHLFFSSNTS